MADKEEIKEENQEQSLPESKEEFESLDDEKQNEIADKALAKVMHEKTEKLQNLELAKVSKHQVATMAELDARRDWAQAMIDNGYVPKSVDTPEKVIAILGYAEALGINPYVAMNNVDVIQGKPSLNINLYTTLAEQSGIEWETIKDFELKETIGQTKIFHTVIRFKKPVILFGKFYGFKSHDVDYTTADAAAAQLLGKDNWKKHPRAMFWARCFTRGLRRIAPSVVLGMYERSEIAESMHLEIDAGAYGLIDAN